MDGIKNSRRRHHVLEKIIRAAIAHRWLVLLLVLGTTGLGIWNYGRLPIDAVPDITNVQVQVNTEAPGYSTLEARSEEHTSELQSLMRITYAVLCLKKKKIHKKTKH